MNIIISLAQLTYMNHVIAPELAFAVPSLVNKVQNTRMVSVIVMAQDNLTVHDYTGPRRVMHSEVSWPRSLIVIILVIVMVSHCHCIIEQ